MGDHMADRFVTVPVLQSSIPPADAEAGPAPVFWVYIDDNGRWRLRKEGGAAEASFSSRAAAARFVQDLAGELSYRLFIETQDGRIVQELHGTTPSPHHGKAEDGIANTPPVAVAGSTADGHKIEKSDLRSRLEWAHQLESAARVSPSRISVLGQWLGKKRAQAV
jgi:hypothetical protein